MKLTNEQIVKLNEYIKNGLVFFQTSPDKNLKIYNYSNTCIYKGAWDDVTMMCRGLVLDNEYNIVTRPFKKFFNLHEEHVDKSLCSNNFVAYEKLDGSLISATMYNGELLITSRGSFISTQAEKAKELIQYYSYDENFLIDKTICLEIIYPDNRIVVDYGSQESLYLIGIIDNNTGKEIPIYSEEFKSSFPKPRKYSVYNILDIKTFINNKSNFEGVVLNFDTGYKVKIKSDEYIRLHKLVTGISKMSIWEFMMNLEEFDTIENLLLKFVSYYTDIPDELKEFITNTIDEYYTLFINSMNKACSTFCIASRYDTRKDQAQYIKENAPELSGIIFNMIDKNGYDIIDSYKKYMRYILKPLKPINTVKFFNFKSMSEDNV